MLAVPAVRGETSHDVVPDLDRADVLADRLDHPGALVAEHGRQGGGIGAFEVVQVGMADPGRDRADQHLVRAGLADRDLLDFEGLADLAQHRSFHSSDPFAWLYRIQGIALATATNAVFNPFRK
jgi:hypothetical protein